ncbi:MAG: hypothetical protein D6772_05730 [Bacteroidetes bacterium]|nr:MAG: hypothetical protein D6772_05730 [Bacteroidota bacterium]
MKPWSIDASELNPQDIPADYIFRNATIDDYLDHTSHERKLFLIGSKGCGKTLLLRYKAYRYWNKMDPDSSLKARVSGSSELVESLSLDIRTLSAKDIMSLVDIALWQKIWKFAIALLALRRLDVKLIEPLQQLNKRFYPHYTLSLIVSKLMGNPEAYLRKPAFEDDLVELNGMLSMVNQPFVLFVDRLDQALDPILSSNDYKYLDDKHGESIPFLVWQAAQYGLLHASYELTTGSNRHIKIFATARKEALDVSSQVAANIRNYCTFLDYSTTELRYIFENNVRQTAKKYLFADPATTDACEAFFGFTQMPHPSAKDEFNQPREEHVFDFLRRHTFERPREILQMGRLVHDQLLTKADFSSKPTPERIQAVRRVVNDASYHIVLKHYMQEIVPAFRQEYVRELAERYGKNLFTREQVDTIDQKHINYLFRAGLLGYVSKGKQVFLPASKHIHDQHVGIQRAKYYVLHPSLDSIFMETHTRHEFYNDFCIIGNGYPFYPPVLPVYSQASLEDLMPQLIPGNGDRVTRWHKANIMIDPELLFSEYFQINCEPNEEKGFRPRRMIDRALQKLTLVAHLNALEKVVAKFGLEREPHIQERRGELKAQIQGLANNYKYSSKIEELSEETINQFEGRLEGRLVALGILVYLSNFNHFRVQQVIREGIVDVPRSSDNEDSAVRFLRRAFFIGNLPSKAVLTKNDRRNILLGAAKNEQELLRRWWVNYKEHYVYALKILQKDHLAYLEQLMNGN